MVVGVVVYKFELAVDEDNEIQPEFKVLYKDITLDYQEMELQEIITLNDLFSIFYTHTAGSRGSATSNKGNFFIGRLKESNYRVISYFKESIDDSLYLTITIFTPNEDSDRFEDIITILSGKMDLIFKKMAKGNMRSATFSRNIDDEIKSNIKFALFQIDRLTNLTKIQKVGLLYMGPERSTTMDLLRQGPISRHSLLMTLQSIKDTTNIDMVLRPFTELNIIRRDWAKGMKDKRSGLLWGQGEYIFMVKDVILIRIPPKQIIEQMETNDSYGAEYLEKLKEFYAEYSPYNKFKEESKLLSSFILNSDIYDLLALLSNRTYAREKMPKVMSEFSDPEKVIDQLIEAKLVTSIKDNAGRNWICLLGEINPLVVFPEYMGTTIQDRVIKKEQSLVDSPIQEPLTLEVARKALDLLESSYTEKIEF